MTAMILKNKDLDRLVFAQPHHESAAWFEKRAGGTHDIGVEHFPPARLLATGDRDELAEYFNASWPFYGRENTEQTRNAHTDWILETAAATTEIVEPLPVVIRPDDGKLLVLDGNHRASFAWLNGLDVPYEVRSAEKWLKNMTVNGGEFFGTQHKGIPYQSLHNRDESVVFAGRRKDMLARHALLDEADLNGKRVVDVGCNIGTASHLASFAGADVHGFDVSGALVTSALRCGVYVNSPARFSMANVDKGVQLSKCDTLFLFSVAAHTKEVASLLPIIRQTQPSVVYVEAHAGWSWSNFEAFAHVFKTAEFRQGPERKMWRCTL